MDTKSRKIAIFGGAFDPPHNVHIDIARAALKEFNYNRIFFLPSHNPPHKNLAAMTNDRLNMLRCAVASEQKFAISTYEIDQSSVGYTVETLPKLREIYGEFDFIIGGDSMCDLHKWYKPEQILAENSIVVAVRDGDIKRAESALKSFENTKLKSVKFMRYIPRSLSSTDIRLAVQLGENVDGYVSETVADYIKCNGVYDNFKIIREKLQSSLDKSRYAHTIGVVKAAIRLNEQCGMDYDKVFLSAMLHDCAKGMKTDAFVDSLPADSIDTPVAHAFAGAAVATTEYGINDCDILDAIYYHTTGRKNMTVLEKLVFTADMIEDGRDFDGVEALRTTSYKNLNEGFIACLQHQYDYLIKTKTPIYHLTLESYEFYCK